MISGFPRETRVSPRYILLPVFAARWTEGPQPLQLAMTVYPSRIATGAACGSQLLDLMSSYGSFEVGC